MATATTITVALSDSTVEALVDGRFRLSALHAVTCDAGGGAPLVWAQTTAFASPSISLSWTEGYSAYGSTLVPPVPAAVVVGTDTVPAAVGDAFDVGPHAELTAVPNGGFPGFITLQNTTSKPFTGGLSLPSPTGGTAVKPICVFPLYGGNSVYLSPEPRVLLMVATPSLAIGNPVRRMYGPTVAVDVAASPTTNLAYDINRGWSGESDSVSIVTPSEFPGLLIGRTATPKRRGDVLASRAKWYP